MQFLRVTIFLFIYWTCCFTSLRHFTTILCRVNAEKGNFSLNSFFIRCNGTNSGSWLYSLCLVPAVSVVIIPSQTPSADLMVVIHGHSFFSMENGAGSFNREEPFFFEQTFSMIRCTMIAGGLLTLIKQKRQNKKENILKRKKGGRR